MTMQTRPSLLKQSTVRTLFIAAALAVLGCNPSQPSTPQSPLAPGGGQTSTQPTSAPSASPSVAVAPSPTSSAAPSAKPRDPDVIPWTRLADLPAELPLK